MSRSPHKLIGIAGKARSGKDTVANFIIAAVGGYRYSFADPIRQMLIPLGIDMSDPYWQARKEEAILALGCSPRHLMQTLGTEWGRQHVNPSLWLTLAHQRLLVSGPGMVISDIRFENEATWVRSLGGRVIHLDRTNTTKVKEHVSEEGVATHPGDFILHNDGGLDDLQNAVKALLHVDET